MKRIRRRQAKTAPRPSFMIPSRNANTRKLHAQPLTPCHKDPCPSSSTTIMWLMATRPRTCDSPMRSSTSSSAPGPEWNRTWASRIATWQRGRWRSAGSHRAWIATAGWSTTPACGGRPGRSRAVFRARFRARPEEGLPQRGRLRHRARRGGKQGRSQHKLDPPSQKLLAQMT